ncbi:HAMP domain-containing sensor histidine kinase [Paenibacillus xylanexedens]|uniref:HAMP domain-containing sensor histidine kinase n=1 Tax=Paenibacillus xylanexedens TaxID=528191 RepID=UPI0021B3F19A|nr:HAMP domain-containing sensor histidine kinase [Paenibacillus xylanexedens]
MSSKNKNISLRGFGLTFMFMFIVMFIFIISIFLAWFIIVFLVYTGLYTPPATDNPDSGGAVVFIAYFGSVTVLVSIFASLIFSRIPLAPIREVIRASEELATGNFSVRIHLKGPKELKKLNKSFNHMAEELGSLEMLRSDFINNFSHEFKTPIVSLRGYAKVLKKKNLSDVERTEYLDIIINESERLAELATNVLQLSKIESQAIITEKTSFNLTEQIRTIIVLLDSKWTAKNISFQFNSSEFTVTANEDMLSQVWINLLDNAIKFSRSNSEITINVDSKGGQLSVSIHNNGPAINVNQQKYIFDKFYQGDASHASPGNGLGLSIARKIVVLHNGSIRVAKSDDMGTTFEVLLQLD